ncbi:MAG: DUF1351 domain-containing protein [Clostridia bacterium]|nr:DUF1351 domain-containing protein [Clostridia bacterium]
MMELILTTPIEDLIPKLIEFNNTEILNQLKPQLEHYKNITYTEEQLPQAKTDRATLNKFKDAIEDERKRIKKVYLVPYEKFEAQVKEITVLIDESTKTIDSQVKSFEEQRKLDKKLKIVEFWNQNIGDLKELINIENVFSEQWLNTTYSMKKVQEDITTFIAKVNQDLAVITSLNFKQETHLKDYYLRTFDLTATLQEKTRLEENEKKLAELSQKQAQEQAKPTKVEEIHQQELKQVDFRVWATQEQLNTIREFLIQNNIKYGKVPTNN